MTRFASPSGRQSTATGVDWVDENSRCDSITDIRTSRVGITVSGGIKEVVGGDQRSVLHGIRTLLRCGRI